MKPSSFLGKNMKSDNSNLIIIVIAVIAGMTLPTLLKSLGFLIEYTVPIVVYMVVFGVVALVALKGVQYGVRYFKKGKTALKDKA